MNLSLSNLWPAIKHGLVVAVHILVAIFVYGIVAYISHHMATFATLEHYGLTIGVTNVILATLWKWTNLPTTDLPTIDGTPTGASYGKN
jgi:hypothetical protein